MIQIIIINIIFYQLLMSRLIVKNIPSNCDERRLKQVFSKVGEVTDCQILQKGSKSRKFCFVGFKTDSEAEQAQKHFNNSFIGTSKVQVQLAKTKDVLLREKKHKNNPEKISAPVNQSRAMGKFQEYKKIVDKGSKQSWNDLVIGNEMIIEEKVKEPIKKTKIQEKKQKKEQAREVHTNKVLNPDSSKEIKIKAPVFSEKNSKFINTPLKVDETRIYVTNFSHDLSEEQLMNIFSAYGSVIKTKFPKNQANGKLQGYGFVTYSQPAESLRAFAQLDNKIVHGRILHVKPALEDIGGLIKAKKEQEYQKRIREKFGDPDEDPTSYKKKQKIQMRQRLDDTTSWNTLFLNPNTLIQHMADKHNMTKSEILLSDGLPAKLTLAEAEVIAQTKDWLVSQGLNLDFMATDRNLCQRSKVILLVKNLHHNTSPQNLKELFSFYGVVRRLMLCPNKSIAIVQFDNEEFAKNAFQKLSYYKFKSNPLYLEYAPINLMSASKIKQKIQQEQQQREYDEQLAQVLYIKNLNFQTSQQALKNHIKNCGNILTVKIIKDKSGTPKGYGFIHFQNKDSVIKALKQYQNSLLDGHTLQLSVSKGKKAAPLDKIKKRQGGVEGKYPKLAIKNIAFQVTKPSELKEVLSHYGSVKKIRLPEKLDKIRGFAFAEYQTMEDARLAFQALGNVHHLGRKLVVEWAKG